MLGFADFWIALAYLLCIASTILCIVYGAMRWNHGGDELPEPPADLDKKWDEEEERIEETVS